MTDVTSGIKVRYAGFRERLLACAIDTMLILVIAVPVLKLIKNTELPEYVIEARGEFQQGKISQEDFLSVMLDYFVNGGGIQQMMYNSAVDMIAIGAIVILFWAYRAATPGKMILAMKVVDAETLGEPAKWQLFARYLGYIVSTVFAGLGFLWIIFDKRKQGWHDKIASTLVIYTKPEPTREERLEKLKRQTIFLLIMMALCLTYIAMRLL